MPGITPISNNLKSEASIKNWLNGSHPITHVKGVITCPSSTGKCRGAAHCHVRPRANHQPWKFNYRPKGSKTGGVGQWHHSPSHSRYNYVLAGKEATAKWGELDADGKKEYSNKAPLSTRFAAPRGALQY